MSNQNAQNPLPVDPLLAADANTREGKEAARLAQATFDADLLHVATSPQGRRFLWRLMERQGMFRTSFTGHRESTDFHEGSRNASLQLWADLKRVCPTRLTQMQDEQNDA